MPKIDIDDLISPGEWCEINGVHKTSITYWRKTYKLFPNHVYKYGVIILYRKSELDKFYVDHWWLGRSRNEREEYMRSYHA